MVLTKPICGLPVCNLCPKSCSKGGQTFREGGGKLRFTHPCPRIISRNAEQPHCPSRWLFWGHNRGPLKAPHDHRGGVLSIYCAPPLMCKNQVVWVGQTLPSQHLLCPHQQTPRLGPIRRHHLSDTGTRPQ